MGDIGAILGTESKLGKQGAAMVIVPGQPLVDNDGNDIGKVTDVISDPSTLRTEWIVVRTGRFGPEHLVPANAVEALEDGSLRAPFTRHQVKAAPRAKDHASPTRPERENLFEHYGMASNAPGPGDSSA
jgi:sporulation protein YlmC with PRC-barrel domain